MSERVDEKRGQEPPPSGRARLWALFDQAADLPPSEQRILLDRACPDDPGLRAAVAKLLADDARLHADQALAGFLASPLVRASQELDPTPTVPGSGPALALPARIGRYRIVRLLGEGGMGTVYQAEQDNPRRAVALKVIRPGLVSPALLKRFAHEARILGSLHHPGIVPIYEAGVAEEGRPFFAMEFIRGLALDDYARRQGLPPAARLDLLARVCDAVQHAHEQGIIHRDLKPGNLLVDEGGQPRVLDFGVARAPAAGQDASTDHTRTGQLLGTLSYMSPEQIAADPAALDARSDVYTLGVILFELLAGRLPYLLEHLALPEVARVIREQEPSRLGSVDPRFRGDVETIVAKALEKDKKRRYSSAGELAADVRRYLNHEMIRARPPSALYHLRKFARRHKALVGGVAGVFTALLVGTVVSILFALRAEKNAAVAREQERRATYQTYRARLAAAVGALANHDVADARQQLDDAPEALRGWEWQHLRSRLDDSSAVIPLPAGEGGFLLGAPARLRAGAMTPAGLRVTDLEGGEPKTLPIGPERGPAVTAVQTRRGLQVVAWVGNTTLELLDEAGQVLRRVEVPKDTWARCVAVSPDGTRLACVRDLGGPHRLALFDATSGKQTALCAGHLGGVRGIAFSPDGARLASAGEDQLASLWDAASGALLATYRGHTSKVLSVAFRPDGTRLVTTSADGTVRQWDAGTGREVEAPYDRHSGEVAAAVYSPDGQLVASAGTDRTIRVWWATGRQDVAILHGHTGPVIGVAFAPGGRRLASVSCPSLLGAGDGTVRVWDVGPRATLPVLGRHRSYVYPVAYSPDGRWIASGGWDGTVRLWDALTGEEGATLPHPSFVRALAFSPDSSWLVSSCDGEEHLSIWDVATGQRQREIPGPGKVLQAVAVSPDGTRLAAVDQEGRLSIQEAATGQEVASRRMSGFSARKDLAYSPDGRWLAGTGADHQIYVWDTQTNQRTATLVGHDGDIFSVAFSPDSRRLVSAGQDRTVRVWDVGAWVCRAVLKGHTDEVFTAVFHPDGTRIASAGRDRAVWLWDVATGEEVARLAGHTTYVFSLAFSPDGATLVSASGDNTVRLWDIEPLARRYQARRAVEALRPEAERLVAGFFRQEGEPARVVQRLRREATLSDPLRHAAQQALWRRLASRPGTTK